MVGFTSAGRPSGRWTVAGRASRRPREEYPIAPTTVRRSVGCSTHAVAVVGARSHARARTWTAARPWHLTWGPSRAPAAARVGGRARGTAGKLISVPGNDWLGGGTSSRTATQVLGDSDGSTRACGGGRPGAALLPAGGAPRPPRSTAATSWEKGFGWTVTVLFVRPVSQQDGKINQLCILIEEEGLIGFLPASTYSSTAASICTYKCNNI